jgi:hypothetical protein
VSAPERRGFGTTVTKAIAAAWTVRSILIMRRQAWCGACAAPHRTRLAPGMINISIYRVGQR